MHVGSNWFVTSLYRKEILSHQIVKQVRVGDMTPEERAARGLVDARDDDVVSIAVGNVVKDTPPPGPAAINLKDGERIEKI